MGQNSSEINDKIKAEVAETKNGIVFHLSLWGIRKGKKIRAKKRALIAEAIAKKLEIDSRIAFLAGFVANMAKKSTNESISFKERSGSINNFFVNFRNGRIFMAYCTELQCALLEEGENLTIEDLAMYFNPQIVKEKLETIKKVAMIIKISNTIETFFRSNKRKGISAEEMNVIKLENKLVEMFPGEYEIIKTALKEGMNILG